MNDELRSSLRMRMRDRRRALTPAARIAAAAGVADSLQRLPEFHTDQRVAGYWAVAGEVPLNIVVARLRARGQQYFLPVVGGHQTLRFAALHADTALRTNRHGIPEPECAPAALLEPAQLELVLLPLTAFDRRGARLGSGAGYYDRSFAFLRGAARPGSPLLVGIGYSFQELPTLPAQPWDVPLDFIATENELIDCTRAEDDSL